MSYWVLLVCLVVPCYYSQSTNETFVSDPTTIEANPEIDPVVTTAKASSYLDNNSMPRNTIAGLIASVSPSTSTVAVGSELKSQMHKMVASDSELEATEEIVVVDDETQEANNKKSEAQTVELLESTELEEEPQANLTISD